MFLLLSTGICAPSPKCSKGSLAPSRSAARLVALALSGRAPIPWKNWYVAAEPGGAGHQKGPFCVKMGIAPRRQIDDHDFSAGRAPDHPSARVGHRYEGFRRIHAVLEDDGGRSATERQRRESAGSRDGNAQHSARPASTIGANLRCVPEEDTGDQRQYPKRDEPSDIPWQRVGNIDPNPMQPDRPVYHYHVDKLPGRETENGPRENDPVW